MTAIKVTLSHIQVVSIRVIDVMKDVTTISSAIPIARVVAHAAPLEKVHTTATTKAVMNDIVTTIAIDAMVAVEGVMSDVILIAVIDGALTRIAETTAIAAAAMMIAEVRVVSVGIQVLV